MAGQHGSSTTRGTQKGYQCHPPHPDGFFVVVSGGTSGGFLLFWKPDQANEFFKLALPNTGRSLDLHPDGLKLATAHHDGHVRIWSMQAKPTA